MIYDTFMGNDEFDMLECRLVELAAIPDLVHVLVEADVDHQGHPKPYHFTENAERFAAWGDRLRIVRATGLPSAVEHPDPWSREHAQREHLRDGLHDASPDDVVLHGDLDEIPTEVFVRNVRPHRFVTAGMRFHPFAVDWLHPEMWPGTVAGYVRDITSFSAMRDARLSGQAIPYSGWHFSWVGGQAYQRSKLGAFCHPEVAAWSKDHIDRDDFYRHGYHVDGTRLEAVEVDGDWPRWIRDLRCPEHWFRPRGQREDITVRAGSILGPGARGNFTEDWFGEPSQRAIAELYGKVKGLPGAIIEVGCWQGRSTCALANAAHPAVVHAVDTWQGSPGEISAELAAGRDVYAEFAANVAELTAGNVEPHRMGWREFFADWSKPVRFLHIDAEHTYTEVRDNILAALPLMVPGGVICGDDAHHPPIRQAVLDVFGPTGRPTYQTATLWWHQIGGDL